nr:formyltetrahydrofolate deformylase [Snodgrassella sp. CFCC 13594]
MIDSAAHAPDSATLLIDAPDQKGLVASIAQFLLQHNANILHADQHQDAEEGRFLMRVEWDVNGFDLPMSAFQQAFAPVAAAKNMQWHLCQPRKRARMAIFVSQYEHCLVDLMHRYRIGELGCDIPLVIGNHESMRHLVEYNRIPFHHIPVSANTKAAAEAQACSLLTDAQVDVIVLARYMQVLSPDFVAQYPNRIINIHHSFLPAFDGARLINVHSLVASNSLAQPAITLPTNWMKGRLSNKR